MMFESFKTKLKCKNCGFEGEPEIIVPTVCYAPTFYRCPKCNKDMENKED